MKKLIVLMLVLFASISASATDKNLSLDDFTLVHFGQIITYDPEYMGEGYIEVAVGEIIKGEHFGKRASYSNISKVGEFEIQHGGKYLIAYTDENSPVYIMETQYVETLKNINDIGLNLEEKEQSENKNQKNLYPIFVGALVVVLIAGTWLVIKKNKQ